MFPQIHSLTPVRRTSYTILLIHLGISGIYTWSKSHVMNLNQSRFYPQKHPLLDLAVIGYS